MRSFLSVAFASLALAFAPVIVLSATVSYAPPAGKMPAGRYRGIPYDAVLPSGRLVTPAGTSLVTGMNTLGLVLSPDGRYAITSNDDEREGAARSILDPEASGGYSLTVVDTMRMLATTHYRAPAETFYSGLVAVRDTRDPANTLVFAAGGASNAVSVFDLDAYGRLVPDAQHTIAIPGPSDPAFADRGISFPSALTAAPDGRRVYVVNGGGESVAVIDVATLRLLGEPKRVGYFPSGIAVAGTRLLVTNEGMMRYGMLPAPLALPTFDRPPADPLNASALSLLALDAGGDLTGASDALPMDAAPDGLRIIGGAHPTAIAAPASGDYAFIAMTSVDRLATVALGATPHVVGGTELRLFDRGPYGTQPAALALSRDASRLYVALAGIDAVAVIDARDPLHLHRLGLIPTGWAPSAVALSSDDRTLYVTNQRGFGHEPDFIGNVMPGVDAGAVWSTLQRIDLSSVKLAATTRATLGALRNVVALPAPLPKAIRNVVLIVEDGKNYDEVLGDLAGGPGAPSFTVYGENATPNLHALARRYALAGNMFAGESTPGTGAQELAGGLSAGFTKRTVGVRYARRPLGYENEDPEDAPRSGTVFHQLARHQLSFRDYGGLLAVSGTTPAGIVQNVPAPAILAGHVDTSYPLRTAAVSDTVRAAEFVRDYSALANGRLAPRFAFVALPGGSSPPAGAAPAPASIADGDRALGTIVDALSRLPTWRTTAIVVVPASARSGRDHIDASRTFALVISPYAKHAYIGMRHLSTASVLKLVDRAFGLPALSLGDLLANDMGDFFQNKPDLRPYTALTVFSPGE